MRKIKEQVEEVLFSNLTALIKRIRYNKDPITNKHLEEYIRDEVNSSQIVKQIDKYKVDHFEIKEYSHKINLFQITTKITGRSLAIGFFLYLGKTIAATLSIFLMDLITDLIESDNELTFNTKLHIAFLLCSLLFLFLLKSAFFSQYEWYQCIWRAQSSTLFQYLIYQKSLKVQANNYSSEKENKNPNDQKKDDKKEVSEDESGQIPDVNNLMSVDIQELMDGYWCIVELGCGIISIVIVLLLIYYRIGEAMLQGMYILILAVCLNGITAYFLAEQYEKLYNWMDKRVALSQDVIEGIKSIKYLGWEQTFEKKILDFRKSEFKYIFTTKSLDCINQIFWNCVSYFLLYSFLTNFMTGEEGKTLKDSNVFTLIALFGFLQYPLLNLPWCFSLLARQKTSFLRIQSFLNEKEIDLSKYKQTIQQGIIGKYLQIDEDEPSRLAKSIKNNIALEIDSMNFVYPGQVEDEEERDYIQQVQAKDNDNVNIEMQLMSKNKVASSQNEKQNFILRVPYITIQRGTLNFIVGEIGSGKTAFLLSIINELKIKEDESTNKRIQINGSIAYVSQNHWLQNRSIRDNILFGNKFDQRWYNRCIQACDLQNDFNNHPNGDNKIVGPGGSNLSGGQRQRICLCRAIYQNSDIYLFDDIFSSLDTHVADNIFQNAITQLLLKEQNKTIMIVTSHYKYLSDKKYISQILYLKNGQVILDQTQIDNYLEHLVQKPSSKTPHNNYLFTGFDEDDYDVKSKHVNKRKSHSTKQQSHSSSRNEHSDITELNEYELDINEEVLEQGEISKQTIMQYLYDMKIQVFVLFIGLNILMKAIQILIDFWLGDQITEEKENFPFINSLFNSFYETLAGLILFFLLVAMVKGILFVLCSLNSCQAAFTKLNRSLMYSQMNFFDKNPVGRIISRLSHDINMIDDYLTWSVHELVDQLSYSLSYPIGIIIQFPWMSIFIIFAIGIGYVTSNLFREANRVLRRIDALNLAKVLTNISETKEGLPIVRSFKKQTFMIEEFLKNLANSMNSFVVSSQIQVWMIIRLLMISNMLFFFIAITILIVFYFDLDFNRNLIALSLTYSILLCEVFGNLIHYFCHTEQSMISVERVRQYYTNEQENLNIPIMQSEKIKNLPLQYIKPNEDTFQEYSIIFDDVSMSYSEISDENIQLNKSQNAENGNTHLQQSKNCNKKSAFYNSENKSCNNDDSYNQNNNDQINICNQSHQIQLNNSNLPSQPEIKINTNIKPIYFALSNINLKIKKGEKIAFCGRTGSGKTSILNALFYLYKVQKGNIYINNKNIKSFTLSQLRSQLSIIPQFGFLYKASLQGNLVPDDKLSSFQIQTRLSKINLNLNKENKYQPPNQITSLQSQINQSQSLIEAEKDLDFQIDDSGSNLSNGEKQIINFFRVVLQDSDIVCLDEATSNMDPKSDQELHKALFQFCQNKTLLVITHRLENIHEFDRVVVMEKGQIIECGHVSTLKSNPDSFFNFLLQQEQKHQQ